MLSIRQSRSTGMATIFLAAVLPAAVPAQVRQDTLTADTALLDPVVVTAARVPRPRSQTVGSVTVLHGDALRAAGLTTVREALREVPGAAVVQTGSFGGQTSLFLRGAESDYTKVLIDGVPVNAPGGALDVSHLTLDNIERIEVVRGPASVLYGSDAVSGVIQLFTRSGIGRRRLEARARGGSHSAREGDLEAEQGGRTLSGSLGAAHRHTDGIFPFNSQYRNTTYSVGVRASADERGDVSLSARWIDADFHYPTTGSGEVVDSNQVRRERRLVVSLDAGRPLGERVEARVLLATTEVSGLSDDQPDSAGDTLGFYSRVESDSHRRTAGARITARPSGDALPLLTFGFDREWQGEVATGTSRFQRFPPTLTSFDEGRMNDGYYAQLLGGVGDVLSYTAGARLDDHSAFGRFLTYRVGTSILAGATRLRASVGTAFKEPTFDEQFNTSFSRGNPALEPERSLAWEAGIEQSLAAGRIAVHATYFDQSFRDLIQYTFTQNPDSANYFNVAAATASGVEVELRMRSSVGVTGSLNATYLETTVTEPGFGAFGAYERRQPLLRRPRLSGGLTLGYRSPVRGGVSVSTQAVGRRQDLDFSTFPATRVELAPYIIVDVAGDARVLGSPGASALYVTARVANLFDHDYTAVAGFPAPGRVVLLGGRFTVGQ